MGTTSFAFVAFTFLASGSTAIAQPPKAKPVLLSTTWDGGNAAEASAAPAVNKNGRFVAFVTDSMAISGTDAPGQAVVLDRESGAYDRVSRSLTGEATDAPCERVAISGDGRIVVYSTRATNVASQEDGATDLDLDLYRYDRATGITTRVSVFDAVTQVGADCGEFDLSDDGRFIAFAARSTASSPLASPDHAQIYLRDVALGITWLLSRAPTGAAADADCGQPRVDDDGSRVVFVSGAKNLGADAAGVPQVWVADLWKSSVSLVSKPSAAGPTSDGPAHAPAISPDGRFVAFASIATNLVPIGANAATEAVYLKDLKTGKLRRLDLAPKGLGDPSYLELDLSRHGKHLAFLARDDSQARAVIGWHARATATTRVMTIAPGGAPVFSGIHGRPAISSDGRYAVFPSDADSLSPEADTASDVYLYRR